MRAALPPVKKIIMRKALTPDYAGRMFHVSPPGGIERRGSVMDFRDPIDLAVLGLMCVLAWFGAYVPALVVFGLIFANIFAPVLVRLTGGQP